MSGDKQVDFDAMAEGVKAGDFGACKAFSDYFSPRFRWMFRRSGMSLMDAEDLAVSCVTDIVLKTSRYEARPGGSFQAWVFHCAYNEFMDWLRDRRKHVGAEPLTPDLAVPAASGEDSQRKMDLVAATEEHMATLTREQQEIVHLRHCRNHYEFSDIEKMTGIKSSTARVMFHRALGKLEALLENDPRVINYFRREIRPQREKA